MARVQRSSDVVEVHGEKALLYAGPGLLLLVLSGFLLKYRGESGMFVPLAIILALGGVGLVIVGIRAAWQIRRVTSVSLVCPCCEATNVLTALPDADFDCVNCHRMVPVRDGAVLPVSQVRCGKCNELNYYSDKTDVLLCESCNHDIPLAQSDDTKPRRQSFHAAKDDETAPCELVLVAEGNKHEEMVECLQHMLALNRNQVKGLLADLPATLLVGIPKRKADLLKAQLEMHGGRAESRRLEAVA